jgi:uncharacterized membrane protein YcgQ (UPF0703/DUF1980 family)
MNGFYAFIIGMVLIVAFFSIATWQHERAHQQINIGSGIKSNIVLSFETGQALTVPREGEKYYSKEDALIARTSHNFNEVVAYNLIPMFVMLAVINVLGFVYLGEKVKQ